MMKVVHPSKFKVVLITLILSAVLVFVQARQADAQGEVALVIIVGGLVATYVTVMGAVCTPVAAVKASDYPGGFSAAFGDCFSLERSMEQTAPEGEHNDASDKPAEKEDEGWYRDDE